ncbi:glycosyltransferase family 2 protein [Lactiplantibacillus plantarum]|uniref:glycosyltransferase family 2 protein n=1 Tax=Lactiplantibacillus plantarum TaxID=1590 RepID=UPI003218C283
MNSKSTCAIIVTYNRIELLKECIDKLLNQTTKINHILIFNNNSTDGTREWLAKMSESDQLIIINSPKNLGGAGGFSEAVRQGYIRTNDNYFWLMDDDTMPNKEVLSSLQTYADNLHNHFGFLCSKVLWKDDSVVNVPILKANKWYSKLNDQILEVERATFVSVFFKRTSVAKVGIPAADMVIWGDDTEYTTRLSNESPSYLVLDSVVYHKTPIKISDVTIVNDDKNRMNRYFYGIRNNLAVSRMYSSRVKTVKIFLKDIKTIIQVLIASKDNKFFRIKTILKGMFVGLFFTPKIKKV